MGRTSISCFEPKEQTTLERVAYMIKKRIIDTERPVFFGIKEKRISLSNFPLEVVINSIYFLLIEKGGSKKSSIIKIFSVKEKPSKDIYHGNLSEKGEEICQIQYIEGMLWDDLIKYIFFKVGQNLDSCFINSEYPIEVGKIEVNFHPSFFEIKRF